MKNNCIFCKIIEGNIPSHRVYEDDFFIGMLDINPANRGHVIVYPKNHAENIFELPDGDAEKILIVVKKIAMAVTEAYGCDGINILQNNGEAAGQSVNHLHIHIIPRFNDDAVSIEWKQNVIDDFEQVKEEIVQKLS